jgi:DNA-directed RNA polymerase specialized sigma24 family protein
MAPSTPPSTPLTFEQLLHQPPVIAAIHRVLPKYGVRVQDLEDGRQEVFRMALCAKGDRPTTLEGTKAFCIVLAHRHGVSLLRRTKKRAEAGYVGPTDLEDEAIAVSDARWDILDRKKLLAELTRSVPGHIVEAFEDVAEGIPQTEIAERLGVSHKKVRSDLEKGRFKYRNAIAGAGLGVLLAAGAGWLLYVRSSATPTEEAHPTPSAAPTQVLAQDDPLAKKKEQAAQLRQQAADLCKNRKFKDCSDTLDRAYALDPEGENDPAVAAVREVADQAMVGKLAPGGKPSQTPAPKPVPTEK